jgi:PAS domain S-box-containing protein
MEHFQNLLLNAALLIIMGFAYTQIFRFFRDRRIVKQLLNGVLFGLIAIAVMTCPAYIKLGLAFDTRSIIISISGLFGGPVVVTISALFAIIYRLIGGGVGTTANILIILSSGILGLGYYYLRKKYKKVMHPLYIFLFGLIVTTFMFLCIFVLPYDMAINAIETIILPVIIIYPLVSFLIISRIMEKEAQIESQNMLNDTFDNLTTGIVIHAPDGSIVFSNPQASILLGLSTDQIHGKADIDPAWNFIQEDGTKMPIDKYPINQVLTTRQPLMEYILGINCSTNNIKWVLVNAFPEFDLDEKLSQVVITFLDITKIKQVKEIIEKSRENLRITLNSIGDGVIATDMGSRVTEMNPKAEKLTGWKFSEAKGKPLQEVFNIVDAKTLKTTHIKGLQSNIAQVNMGNHNTLVSKDGCKYQISDSCSPIKDEAGNISGVVLVFRDMTDDYQIRNEINERVKELECLRNLSTILEIEDVSIEEICRKVLNILPVAFKYPERTCAKIIIDGAEYKTDNYEKSEYVLSNNIKKFGILEICYLEGEYKLDRNVFLQEEYELVFIITERLAKAVERKILTESLIVSKEEAECANKAKSEFISNMSHEIRSPLNGLLGFSEIMEKSLHEIDDSKHRNKLLEYLDIIKKCGQNVTILISDILELVDIKGEKSDALLDKFSPKQLIAESIKILNFKAEENNIALIFQHKNLPLEVIGAQRRLKQIIFNLVGNAIKFTEKGSVNVKADYKDENLLIEVKDTGIGIAADMKNKILEPFTKSNQSSNQKYKGTGLGLAIISKILENLGGSLDIKSKLNKGTTISFSFPVKVNKDDVSKKIKKQSIQKTKTRILVIEDDKITSLYLDKILSNFDVEHKIAESFTHMEKICNKDFAPNIALIDISLPDSDGFECMKWLRNKFPEKDIKCIAQTAHVLQEDIKHYKEAGFNDYICKPYVQTELIELITNGLK